jgi:hypothetical protein
MCVVRGDYVFPLKLHRAQHPQHYGMGKRASFAGSPLCSHRQTIRPAADLFA